MEIIDKGRQLYQDPFGFHLRHPPGWGACRHATGAAFVISRDQRSFVLLQEMWTLAGAMPVDIVQRGTFPGAAILQQGQAGPIESNGNGRVSCYVRFRFPENASGLALVACESLGDRLLVSVCAAREPVGLQKAASLLWWITRSYRRIRFRLHGKPGHGSANHIHSRRQRAGLPFNGRTELDYRFEFWFPRTGANSWILLTTGPCRVGPRPVRMAG
jgi:hypothetical protein